jgi:alanyl-tRNA synthetase
VDPELLRKIESIVNGQIKDELGVFAKEATLAEAKQINGLRAVFGEVRLAALYAPYSDFFACRLSSLSHSPTHSLSLSQVYPDPVRVVSIGRKVEDLLANPENEEWLSISAELCGGIVLYNDITSVLACFKFLVDSDFIKIIAGTHITNTREAKAFALLSEEGIAKGIRRITAVTTDGAFKAMELAHSLEQEVDEASKADGSLLEKVSLKNFSY